MTLGISTRITGTVVSRKMNKTGVVVTPVFYWNNKYKVRVKRNVKVLFHDEDEVTNVGDVVQIIHAGQKLSKKKSYALDKVVEKNPMIIALEKENVDAQKAMQKLREMESKIVQDVNVRLEKNHPKDTIQKE